MPPNSFQKAILDARDVFIEAFLAKVPTYTGISRAQLDKIQISTSEMRVTFSVPHFLYNEKYNANAVGFNLTTPGPYNAIPSAKAAAEEVLRAEFERQLKLIAGRLTWNK